MTEPYHHTISALPINTPFPIHPFNTPSQSVRLTFFCLLFCLFFIAAPEHYEAPSSLWRQDAWASPRRATCPWVTASARARATKAAKSTTSVKRASPRTVTIPMGYHRRPTTTISTELRILSYLKGRIMPTYLPNSNPHPASTNTTLPFLLFFPTFGPTTSTSEKPVRGARRAQRRSFEAILGDPPPTHTHNLILSYYIPRMR